MVECNKCTRKKKLRQLRIECREKDSFYITWTSIINAYISDITTNFGFRCVSLICGNGRRKFCSTKCTRSQLYTHIIPNITTQSIFVLFFFIDCKLKNVISYRANGQFTIPFCTSMVLLSLLHVLVLVIHWTEHYI